MQPQRTPALLWLAAMTALLGAAAALWSVTGRFYRGVESSLAQERVHVERVQELERAAAAAHAATVARWISDGTRRNERDDHTLAAIEALRDSMQRLAQLVPFDVDEEAAAIRVLSAAAVVNNQVQQALFTSDVVGTTSDLQLAMESLRLQATAMTARVSQAGRTSDDELRHLRRQQHAIELTFVLVTMAILTGAVRSLRAQLRASEALQRLAAAKADERAHYFANMSHELRTPLAAIRGFASSIDRDEARQIEAHAQELLGVINNILDASKLEAGAMQLSVEDIDVTEVVERCVARCQSLVGQKTIELRAGASGGPIVARGDFVKLQQVVTNLVANAVKFTERGHVEVRAQLRDDWVVIEVEDSGIGIAPTAQALIWQAFRQAESTTDRRFGGTGLGLSIVKGLVERMGGRVGLSSQLGVGSLFRVELPAASAQRLEAAS